MKNALEFKPGAALLSVSDQCGLIQIASALSACGFKLIASSGTGKALAAGGIKSTPIEDYTKQAELFGGRVKTLHPYIYAGILARRFVEADMRELERRELLPIDIVVANLYPFEDRVNQNLSFEEMVELIDVGGPSMLRAAAKNFDAVFSIIDPGDYAALAPKISLWAAGEEGGWFSDSARKARLKCAGKVFETLLSDTACISSYLGEKCPGGAQEKPAIAGNNCRIELRRVQALRYGENPHQEADYYEIAKAVAFQGGAKLQISDSAKLRWSQLAGKELSYNNLLDCDAALRIYDDLEGFGAACAIIKHLTPCGAAKAANLPEALMLAKRSDPRSHFGGIVVFSQKLDEQSARMVREDFAEIVIAPGYDPQALEVLRSSKNLRVIEIQPRTGGEPFRRQLEFRSACGGVLMQSRDVDLSSSAQWKLVAGHEPGPDVLQDLSFAWMISRHVRSNAVVIVKNSCVIGIGGGQTSRIDAVDVALMKAKEHGHDLSGAVCASDAFFPFPDSVERLCASGVKAIVAPSGSKRDDDSVTAAAKLGAALYFAPDRHFRH